jgi:purine-binding chemotaxis protein CheW
MAGNKLDLLVFQTARYRYAFNLHAIVEVQLIPALVQSPVHATILDGFFDLRGTIVPVVPLSALFGLPTELPGLYTPIIVIETAGHPVAIRVDRVDQVAEVPYAAIQPYSKEDSLNGCAEGQVNVGGFDVVVLSADRLLLREEQAMLEDIQATLQKRIESLKDVGR